MRPALPLLGLSLPAQPLLQARRGAARAVVTAAVAAGLVACTLTPAAAAGLPTMVPASVATTTAVAPSAFVTDTFNRAVTGGWGTAPLGGAWTTTGTATFSVASGAGKQTVASGQTAAAYLNAVSSKDSDVRVDVAFDGKAGAGASAYASVMARDVKGVGDYRGRAVVTAGGAVEVHVSRGATLLKKAVVTGLAYRAGTKLSVRTQVTGTSPTTVRAKVWKAGTTEPSAWQVSTTDSTAGLQVAGRVVLSTYTSGSTTPVTASYSALHAAPTTAPTTSVVPSTTTTSDLASDAFGRALTGGWGTAVVGGAWSAAATGAQYSVAAGAGKHRVTAGQTGQTHLGALSLTSSDVRVDVAFDRPAGAGSSAYASVLGREVKGVGDYRARLVVNKSGQVELVAARGATVLQTVTPAGLAYAANTKFSVRVQTFGTSPTTIRAKVWTAGTTEPGDWNVAVTDSTAGMQAAGRVALSTYQSGSSTPVTGSYSSLRVTTASTANLVNAVPSATFAASASGLMSTLDAAGSTDPDGSIVSYAWDHGDGTSGTGVKTNHSYAKAGTYTVALTVTDNQGATARTTRTVTALASTRKLALHPFTSTSPWNTAIGSGAQFESATGTRTASFLTASPNINRTSWSIPVFQAKTSDPMATLVAVRNRTSYTINIPASTVAAVGTDGHSTIVAPDGLTAYDTFKLVKVSDTHYEAQVVSVTDLHGTGIGAGVRAAATPGMAGLIRAHEVSSLNIPHALAVAVPNTVLKNGPVWPAARQDSDGVAAYSGQVPMGTLLAIPGSVNVDSLAVSAEGKALARALQNYGAYVVDRAGTAALYCELACDGQATTRMTNDWKVLFRHMRTVTNSTTTTVGGGGTPRVAPLS